MPYAKGLQGLVDYSRSPETTDSAAIDPLFTSTQIFNEAGQVDNPFYWSSTTHLGFRNRPGERAAYVALGRVLGYMRRA